MWCDIFLHATKLSKTTFQALIEELSAECGDLLLHPEIGCAQEGQSTAVFLSIHGFQTGGHYFAASTLPF